MTDTSRISRHIILVGFMGSGKSTVGKLLSERLHCPLYEGDAAIEEYSGQSIPDIFAKDGEEAFRAIELEVMQQILRKPAGIIMTGGGIVTTKKSRLILNAAPSLNVWLQVKFEDAAQRVQQDNSNMRPLFADKDAAKKRFDERLKWYQEVADVTIEASNKSPNEIADVIIQEIDKVGPTHTQHCYIIGDPVSHSFSPYLHNTVYRLLGVHDTFIYEAMQVKNDELTEVMQKIRSPQTRGVSVTVPHKVAVLPYLDVVDPLAQHIGAVNTIVNDSGILHGYNTDAEGVLVPLLSRTKTDNLKDLKVLILGAGGAARAAVCATAQAGATVTVANRTYKKAQELADTAHGTASSLEDIQERLTSFDIIVNTTSVGMGKIGNTDTPLPHASFNKNQIVFDAVYAPHETQLIKDAKKSNAQVIYGLEMLGTQAVGQIKRFTGKDINVERVMKILKARIT